MGRPHSESAGTLLLSCCLQRARHLHTSRCLLMPSAGPSERAAARLLANSFSHDPSEYTVAFSSLFCRRSRSNSTLRPRKQHCGRSLLPRHSAVSPISSSTSPPIVPSLLAAALQLRLLLNQRVEPVCAVPCWLSHSHARFACGIAAYHCLTKHVFRGPKPPKISQFR